MLSRIFDTDNIVFRSISTVGYLWWLHILWLVCSLPVVTLGASTTALCYSCMKLHKKEGHVTENFFRSFKENFRQATALFLIFAVVGAVLILDIFAGSSSGTTFGNLVKYCALTLLIPYLLMAVYAFAIQARFINPVGKTLKYSFFMALKYFKFTLQIICVIAAAVMLNTTIVLVNFVTLSMGMGIVMYILTVYYNKIFSKVIEEQK